MTQATKDPIVVVALSSCVNIQMDLTTDQLVFLQTLFVNYLEKKIPFNEANELIEKILKSNKPLLEINMILDCENKPALSNNSDDKSGVCSNDIDIYERNDKKKKNSKWSVEEDQRIIFALHKFGQDWNRISSFVGNGRTRGMVSQRWNRVLNPQINRSEWELNEDVNLMELVQKYGTKRWVKIAHEIGDRSDVQCRYRFQQLERSGRINFLKQQIENKSKEIEPNEIQQNEIKPNENNNQQASKSISENNQLESFHFDNNYFDDLLCNSENNDNNLFNYKENKNNDKKDDEDPVLLPESDDMGWENVNFMGVEAEKEYAEFFTDFENTLSFN